MDAYALVDNTTRRKMDEMLKTWKEPVPGSIDTRPVFPPDVVRPIENALIKARTEALQAHQDSMRGQQQLLGRGRPQVPFRETPTPPGGRPGLPHQAGPYGHQPYPGMNGAPQGNPAMSQPPYHMQPNHHVSFLPSLSRPINICSPLTEQSRHNHHLSTSSRLGQPHNPAHP